MFQSTPPYGGRRQLVSADPAHRHVSIHAPVRGATEAQAKAVEEEVFQSTPPYGGRLSKVSPETKISSCFNPRPRTGGDASQRSAQTQSTSFNPRPRTGGD